MPAKVHSTKKKKLLEYSQKQQEVRIKSKQRVHQWYFSLIFMKVRNYLFHLFILLQVLRVTNINFLLTRSIHNDKKGYEK